MTLFLLACKKDLPKSIKPGHYVWVHSYSDEFESESFQTNDTTYSVKIKRNGAYIFYRNEEVIVNGKFDGDDHFKGLPEYYNWGWHYFSAEEDRINIWSYPIVDHTNTFLKL
jgi:hypothetical protein